jgi:hypothetical protein
MLSTEELTQSLFKNISKKLQPQLNSDDYKKITIILDTLQLIFTTRLPKTTDNSNQYTQDNNHSHEDFDI